MKTLKEYTKDFPNPTGHAVGALYDYGDGKPKEFACKRSVKIHWFKKHNGWGFSDAILKDLEKMGCTHVTIESYENEGTPVTKKWQVAFPALLEHATAPMSYGGFEQQRHLPKNFWKIKDLATGKVTDSKPARAKVARKPSVKRVLARKIVLNPSIKCGTCGVNQSEMAPPSAHCTPCREKLAIESHNNYQAWKKERGLPTETREEELARIQEEHKIDERQRLERLQVGAGVAG